MSDSKTTALRVRANGGSLLRWPSLLLAAWVAGAMRCEAQILLLPPGGEPAMAGSQFGDVLRAADLDRDGYCDLLVADPAHRDKRGGVWCHRGSPAGLSAKSTWNLEGTVPGERFGRGLAVLDVDWDGWPDVVVASDGRDPEGIETCRLRVVRGGPQGFASDPLEVWHGRWDELYLAQQALAVEDINADGHPDLVCAGLLPGPGEFPVHCVFALPSTPTGLAGKVAWRVPQFGLGHTFGQAIANAGDFNGDGHPDLLVSVQSHPDRQTQRGRVYLFPGASNGIATAPSWHADYPLPERRGVDAPGVHLFGYDAIGLGDANGDGIDDIAVAAPYADHDEVDEGAVFVFFGSRRGLPNRPEVVLEADQDFTVLGFALAAVGDVDGDGRADFVAGAPTATHDQPSEGAVVLFRGRTGGNWGAPVWARASDRSHWRLGHRVVAGDFNGDGRKDVATTAYNPSASAAVFVWLLTDQTLSAPLAWAPGKSWAKWVEQRWNWSRPWQRGLAVLGLVLAVAGPVAWGVWHFRRARRMREEAKSAVHRERLRIAQDLHDELGAPMHRLRGGAQEGDAAGNARDVVTGIERVIWSVHPERRSLDDLACGLMDLTGNVLGDTSIRQRFEFPEDLTEEVLSAECLTAVYRAAQEALNNVRKHSRATEVRVGMVLGADSARVVVVDDGVGLTSGDGDRDAGEGAGAASSVRRGAGPGHGLRNMASRLRAVGGDATWEPGSPRGLRVELRFPRPRASGNSGRP